MNCCSLVLFRKRTELSNGVIMKKYIVVGLLGIFLIISCKELFNGLDISALPIKIKIVK